MNIFRVMASGKHSFREEFVSAFLAWLLSPNMDHGLGSTFLSMLLTEIAGKVQSPALLELASQLGEVLWEDVLEGGDRRPTVELEVAYPRQSGKGFIDIVVRCGDYFIVLENKIAVASKTADQLKEQYRGFRLLLKERGFTERSRIVLI